MSEKYKYVFVGIPFSGSTAISNELCLNYGGKRVFSKHANLYLLEDSGIDLSQYTVAAVIRNPAEMLRTHFSKLRNPPEGHFVDPKFDVENGGHLRKIDHKRHAMIKKWDMSFFDYLKRYHLLPYDTFYSLNEAKINYVIEFSSLNTSFHAFLEHCGITPVRNLPVINRSTNKPEVLFSKEPIPLCFKPFLYQYQDLLGISVSRPNFAYYFLYKLLKPARFLRWKHFDQRLKATARPE